MRWDRRPWVTPVYKVYRELQQSRYYKEALMSLKQPHLQFYPDMQKCMDNSFVIDSRAYNRCD
eukprot:c10064_g2_i1 orf=75-263(+)